MAHRKCVFCSEKYWDDKEYFAHVKICGGKRHDEDL